MLQLIRDIINYSNLKSGDNVRVVCDLNDLMKEVVEKLSPEIENKNAKLEIGELCPVNVVRAQFIQLMCHLIANSLKFTEEKQTPVIKLESRVETGDFNSPSGYCVIEVRDNGIGFEPHFETKVFEVFQRLHTQESYPGTGIGLAICKKIVENHNGSIEARSVLGKGTTISVRLPLGVHNGSQAS
jgi:signal transduction histidine kinase